MLLWWLQRPQHFWHEGKDGPNAPIIKTNTIIKTSRKIIATQ